VVKHGEVLTPPIDAGLLAGITREYLFEVGAAIGVQVREAVLHDSDLLSADEAFLTSTTREVVPIVRVDEHIIGTGRPGAITWKLLEAFRQAARGVTERTANYRVGVRSTS
jgi:branched-chain amino acid aminotransferase